MNGLQQEIDALEALAIDDVNRHTTTRCASSASYSRIGVRKPTTSYSNVAPSSDEDQAVERASGWRLICSAGSPRHDMGQTTRGVAIDRSAKARGMPGLSRIRCGIL